MSAAPSSDAPLYRFACPHCGKTVKILVAWAGRRGRCSNCGWILTFPRTTLASPHHSQTAEQFAAILAGDVGAHHFLDRATGDRLATFLAQGVCADYLAAHATLTRFGDGRLTAKQWRRVLLVASRREALRMDLLAGLAEADTPLPADRTDLLFGTNIPDDQTLVEPACGIMTRYLHFLRRHTCAGCRDNPTGMDCMYHDFPTFLAKVNWSDDRRTRWQQACQDALGLLMPSRAA